MQNPERSVIFQGPNVREIAPDNNLVRVGLTHKTLKEQVENGNVKNGLVVINTHGSTHKPPHCIQMENEAWQETHLIFATLAKSHAALKIQLFACYSSAACANEIVSKLPAGSFVGFYAPHAEVSRMEVAEKLIDKSLALKKQGISIEEILWSVAPFCKTTIAYRHPKLGFQFIELNFDYKTIKNQNDLLKKRYETLIHYNAFLEKIGLKFIDVKIINHINWFKDMWFMQIVIELTTSHVTRATAIDYLSSVTNDLKSHKMTLAGVQNSNLIDYFRAWRDENIRRGNSAENDNTIIQALEPLYTAATPTTSYSSLFPAANNSVQSQVPMLNSLAPPSETQTTPSAKVT